MFRSKQRNRVIIAVTGILLLLTITRLLFDYFNYQYQMVVAEERERLMSITEYLETHFNARLVGLKLLASHHDVRTLESEVARADMLAAAQALDVANVALYDRKGMLIADCWPASAKIESPFARTNFERDFKTALLGDANVSERMLDNNLENAYVSLQVPVMEGERVLGILAAYMPIRDISLAVLRESMPASQYVFVVDGNGQFIHHPRLDQLFPESKGLKRQMRDLFLHKSGTAKIHSPLDGLDKLIIYSNLQNTDWRVATVIPLDDFYSRVFSKAIEDAKSLLLLVICSGLLYGFWVQSRRHEREREQLRMERMMSVNQLAAGIAHEIRNPLTSIQGFIQLMLRRGNKPVPSEHLEIIISEIGRIDSLISEFQMLARPLKEPLIEKVNVCKLLNDILLLMKGQFYYKMLALDLRLPEENCFALGDVSQLKQVFINLVKNAMEAAPSGGNVRVTAEYYMDKVSVTVENEGEGIPTEIIEKLGTPFFTTKANGTGLGLSVCYSIVQNHGGKIVVSSSVDKRTIFTVLLPAAKMDVENILLD